MLLSILLLRAGMLESIYSLHIAMLVSILSTMLQDNFWLSSFDLATLGLRYVLHSQVPQPTYYWK